MGTFLPLVVIPVLFFLFAWAFSARLKQVSIVTLITEIKIKKKEETMNMKKNKLTILAAITVLGLSVLSGCGAGGQRSGESRRRKW